MKTMQDVGVFAVAAGLCFCLGQLAYADWAYTPGSPATITDGNWTLKVSNLDAVSGTLTLGSGTGNNNAYTSGGGDLDLGDIVVNDGGTSYRVTTLTQKAFYGNTAITNVILPSTLVAVADYAFYNTWQLKTVQLASTSLVAIGTSAFGNTYDGGTKKKLYSVNMDAPNLQSIGSGAFYCTYYLTNDVASLVPPGVTNVGQNAFFRCYPLYGELEVTNLCVLGGDAFNACSLTGIRISGDNLTTIPNAVSGSGGGMFYGNGKLTNAVFNTPNLAFIGSSAFSSCTRLASDIAAIVPSCVTNIGSYAFWNVPCVGNLASTNLVYLGYMAFQSTSVEDVNIASMKMGALSSSVFRYCSSLTNLVLECPALAMIGDSSCGGASKLADLVVGAAGTITNVVSTAFTGCSRLGALTFRGPAPSAAVLTNILIAVSSPASPPYPCTICASKRQDGWRALARPLDADGEEAAAPEKCFGVYLYKNVWMVDQASPYDRFKGTVVLAL